MGSLFGGQDERREERGTLPRMVYFTVTAGRRICSRIAISAYIGSMRVENSQNVSSRAPRWLSGSLAVLMAISPVTGLTAEAPVVSAASSHKKTARSAKGKSHTHAKSQAARTARIHQAFVASTELRPMAQQLATLRTPAAYEGVTHYAQTHSGEAAGRDLGRSGGSRNHHR